MRHCPPAGGSFTLLLRVFVQRHQLLSPALGAIVHLLGRHAAAILRSGFSATSKMAPRILQASQAPGRDCLLLGSPALQVRSQATPTTFPPSMAAREAAPPAGPPRAAALSPNERCHPSLGTRNPFL